MNAPLLKVEGLTRQYTRGVFKRQVTFSLAADFEIEGPGVVGVMGPNGSGKTTMFELITGSDLPTAGRVLVGGQDIHAVRYSERDRLASPITSTSRARAASAFCSCRMVR